MHSGSQPHPRTKTQCVLIFVIEQMSVLIPHEQEKFHSDGWILIYNRPGHPNTQAFLQGKVSPSPIFPPTADPQSHLLKMVEKHPILVQCRHLVEETERTESEPMELRVKGTQAG